MQKFISCDWGTSSLRLRVIDINKMFVFAEVQSEQGIAVTSDLWQQSRKKEEQRLSFYQSILTEQIRKMEQQLDLTLQDMPLIISGMASSNIGMMKLPYTEAPFSMDGHDLHVKEINASDNFKHNVLLISGVRKDNDVMRGEETQLIGCFNEGEKEDGFFVFPGTHSKHIIVRDGKAVDFKTFMTGEFFELLSKKSILSNAVEENRHILNEDNLKSFEKGVADGLHLNLLHASFLVRTNDLFDKLSKQENYFFLSGLLIGTELKELIAVKMPLTVVSDESQIKLYGIALRKLGVHKVKYLDAGKAVIAGHCKMYNLYIKKIAGNRNN